MRRGQDSRGLARPGVSAWGTRLAAPSERRQPYLSRAPIVRMRHPLRSLTACLKSGRGVMRLLHIRAQTDEDTDCLMRELAVYSPKRLRRTLLLELSADRPEQQLLGLLSAIDTCLNANDIRSVRVELDGKPYLLASGR